MGEDKPLVSVVIPTYNRANLLPRALDSVLNQTYENLEVIVVDDGSKDDTEEVMKEYDDPRVKYIRFEENKGANVARNTGIKSAESNFIALQDSDDKWLPKKLEKQMDLYLEDPDTPKLVYCKVRGTFANGSTVTVPENWVNPKEGYLHDQLLRSNFVSTVGMLTEKKCLEKVGYFDEELPRKQDWDLALRLSKHFEFKFIDEVLVHAYHEDQHIQSDVDALLEAYELIFEKQIENFLEYPSILASHYFRIASGYIHKKELDKATEYQKKAFDVDRYSIWNILKFFASFFGVSFYKNFRGLYRRITLFP